MRRAQLVGSPCCLPKLPLEELLAAYAELGFRKFEAFTAWVQSALDPAGDPAAARRAFERHGMTVASLHLPVIRPEDRESPARAVGAARYAAALGARVVLFKASSRDEYARAARPFLDAIEGLGLTAAVQNHCRSAISSLADLREVLERAADPRLQAVLEVGHFHSAGVKWPEAYDLLRGRVALVHIKDQVGTQSVPFGRGEIDLAGLFARLAADGYAGDCVVELEVADGENTLRYLREGLSWLAQFDAGGP